MKRYEIMITGIVQGVGFRPFIYKSAMKYKITGFVKNTIDGVLIQAQGKEVDLNDFISYIKNNPPVSSKIKTFNLKQVPLKEEEEFKILKSDGIYRYKPEIIPDIAICNKCLSEIVDKKNRRYFYPFTNCVDCGPRFTIIRNLPYDRENTSMKEFEMCPECKTEYNNSEDRRFHAQTNCCEICGPQVFLADSSGKRILTGSDAIKRLAKLLVEDKIVAIKGIGGFHLACNAFSATSVKNLRKRKNREEKPFALMAKDLETVKKFCFVSEEEKKYLVSPPAPIVLLKKKEKLRIFEEIAPRNNCLGIMLPYSGIHRLIFESEPSLKLLVMTSGNYSEQPICTDNKQALKMLSGIADFFLFHDREIVTGCDDSVMKVLSDNTMMFIRRSRGFAPESVVLPFISKKKILACGGNMKNTFSLISDNTLYVSHHTGDLDSRSAFDFYVSSIERYMKILKIKPEIIAYDAHPEYSSTHLALSNDFFPEAIKIPVYHHHAHICACMLENGLKNKKVIGIAFDGTGYGKDGTLWGSEFLLCDYSDFERKAHLRPFKLPGTEQAIKQIWRIAVSSLMDVYGKDYNKKLTFLKKLKKEELEIVEKMIENNLNCAYSTGMGRLFDAVSCMCGLRNFINYEGQAAAELESIIEENSSDTPYRFDITEESGKYVIDWRIMIKEIVNDILKNVSSNRISHRFHLTVVKMIYEITELLSRETKIKDVVISGGTFQNVFLTMKVKEILGKNGFKVYSHKVLPPNDGCVSAGQAAVASHLQ